MQQISKKPLSSSLAAQAILSFSLISTRRACSPTREYLGFALTEEGAWTQDVVFAKFDVVIESQSQRAYAAAYAKTMSAVAEGVGVIAAASRDNRERQTASVNTRAQVDQIVKNYIR